MMKKVIAFLLAVFMLCTNVGATVSTHLCGGKAATSAISFGRLDLRCGMDRMANACNNPSGEKGVASTSCCDNQFLELGIDDDADTPKIHSTPTNNNFLLAFVESYHLSFQHPLLLKAPYANYIPPLLKHDIPVLCQSFLI